MLIHAAAFNPSLTLRQMLGVGTARRADVLGRPRFGDSSAPGGRWAQIRANPRNRAAVARNKREPPRSVLLAAKREFVHGLLRCGASAKDFA